MFGTVHPALISISTSGSRKYLYFRLLDLSLPLLSQQAQVMFYRRLGDEEQAMTMSKEQLLATIEIATQQHTQLDTQLYAHWRGLTNAITANQTIGEFKQALRSTYANHW
jgi:hypothetical protein